MPKLTDTTGIVMKGSRVYVTAQELESLDDATGYLSAIRKRFGTKLF
jgi:hypothetical protein